MYHGENVGYFLRSIHGFGFKAVCGVKIAQQSITSDFQY
jgi:hypothetical protein